MTFDPLAQLLSETTESTDWDFGIVTAVSGLTAATVNVGGKTATYPTGYPAQVGDAVVVLRRGKYRVAIAGTSAPAPTVGTVTALPGSGRVTVSVNGASLTLPYMTHYSPANGDSVCVLNGAVLGKWAGTVGTPSVPAVPPPPPAAPKSGTTTFPAVDTATYRSGWRTDSTSVFQGSTGTGANNGAWFYGTAPSAALSGVTVTAASIWLNRMRGSGADGAQAVHLYQHTSATRPGGDVTRTAGPSDVSLSPGDSGWYSPTSLVAWAQNIVNGTARGIGVSGNPYLKLTGLGEDGQSGSLQVSWTRF